MDHMKESSITLSHKYRQTLFVCSLGTNLVGYKAPGSTASSLQDTLFSPPFPLPRNATNTYLPPPC